MAASDMISGEVSSMSDYIFTGVREAIIGAISGAVMGGVFEKLGVSLSTLTGKMLFGGATGVFESVLRQLIQDHKIDIGTLIFDGMIGAATGGIFHGLGKASKGLGSKFSKAFPGISDELSNCFRALSGKAKDDLIALGRYIDDIVNRLNPKGVAVDAYGGKYSLPNDKSTFEDFINYIVGHGDDSVGKVSGSGSKTADNIAKNLDTNNIPNMTKQEIIDAIPDNWKYTEHNGFVHIKDEAGKMRIRIDPPDKVTQYPHVHVYDDDGNLLDSLGNIVDRKSPDGHIPYKN